MEKWKAIPNTKGYYKASTKGRIKSKSRKGSSGGVLKPGKSRKGYDIVAICINGVPKTQKVHRLVAKTFIPNPKNKPQVNHKNNIKDDNRVENLEWVTNQENRDHAVLNDHISRGEDAGPSKLSEKDILQIRSVYDQGLFLQKEIAKAYNIQQPAVSRIVNRKVWTHI